MNPFRQITLLLVVLATLLLPKTYAATNVVAATAPGSLAFHLATNAAARAAQLLGTQEEMVEIHAPLSLEANRFFQPAWSHDCWLKGVQGLPATCIGFDGVHNGQGLATMVSPRHYLCATHMHPEIYTMAFLDVNNHLHWRRTLARVDVGGDTSVGLLEDDLPATVGFLPVLPENFTNYLPTTADFPPASTNFYFQGIGMNQDMCLFGEPMLFWHPEFATWNAGVAVTNGLGTNWNVRIRGGDSSNPAMLLVGNQLVLVSHNFYSAGGPNYASQFSSINRAMHLLSTNHFLHTDYQLTPFPLTNWPAFQ
jgi:hypothetical protein